MGGGKRKNKAAGAARAGARKAFYEVAVTEHFSAAHRLRGYPGSCAKLHGHNWLVEVAVRCERLDALGMAEDFRRLRAAVRSAIERFDHSDLNELPEFSSANPTSELIARRVFDAVAAKLGGHGRRVARVTVSESPGNKASYRMEAGPGEH